VATKATNPKYRRSSKTTDIYDNPAYVSTVLRSDQFSTYRQKCNH